MAQSIIELEKVKFEKSSGWNYLTLRGRQTPHWAQFGKGAFYAKFSTNDNRNDFQIDIEEYSFESKHTKRVMVGLDNEQALALYKHLKGRFEGYEPPVGHPKDGIID